MKTRCGNCRMKIDTSSFSLQWQERTNELREAMWSASLFARVVRAAAVLAGPPVLGRRKPEKRGERGCERGREGEECRVLEKERERETETSRRGEEGLVLRVDGGCERRERRTRREKVAPSLVAWPANVLQYLCTLRDSWRRADSLQWCSIMM